MTYVTGISIPAIITPSLQYYTYKQSFTDAILLGFIWRHILEWGVNSKHRHSGRSETKLKCPIYVLVLCLVVNMYFFEVFVPLLFCSITMDTFEVDPHSIHYYKTRRRGARWLGGALAHFFAGIMLKFIHTMNNIK